MVQASPLYIGADPTGLSYRTIDNQRIEAIITGHKGNPAPTYAEAGMEWIDDTATPWVLKRYDGVAWCIMGTIDPSTHTYTPNPQGPFLVNANSTPNMTVVVSAGTIQVGNVVVAKTSQTTSTITAPSSHPRIDRVVVDMVSGVASVITGTESVSPSAPAVPYGKYACAQILLQTTTTAITQSLITDERPDLWSVEVGTSSLSSASTTDLGSVNAKVITVTGTTTISSFGSSVPAGAPPKIVTFAGALTLTHNATSLILPNNGSNITTAAGDTCIAVSLGSGNWQVVVYIRANGQSLQVSSGVVTLTGTGQAVSGGAHVTPYNAGTGSGGGTITIDCGNCDLQYMVNGGNFTIAAPSNDGSCAILLRNNGSAGTITWSGFSVSSNTGDSLDTISGHCFLLIITRITDGTGSKATYSILALQ